MSLFYMHIFYKIRYRSEFNDTDLCWLLLPWVNIWDFKVPKENIFYLLIENRKALLIKHISLPRETYIV